MADTLLKPGTNLQVLDISNNKIMVCAVPHLSLCRTRAGSC